MGRESYSKTENSKELEDTEGREGKSDVHLQRLSVIGYDDQRWWRPREKREKPTVLVLPTYSMTRLRSHRKAVQDVRVMTVMKKAARTNGIGEGNWETPDAGSGKGKMHHAGVMMP